MRLRVMAPPMVLAALLLTACSAEQALPDRVPPAEVTSVSPHVTTAVTSPGRPAVQTDSWRDYDRTEEASTPATTPIVESVVTPLQSSPEPAQVAPSYQPVTTSAVPAPTTTLPTTSISVITPQPTPYIPEVYEGQPCSGPDQRGRFGHVPAGCIEGNNGKYYWHIFF